MGQGAKISTGKLVRKYIGEGLEPFGFVYTGSDKGYWAYGDEASLIETLQTMKEVLIRKCLRILNEMSKPDEMELTNEMFRELYFHHAELAERFQKRTGLEADQMDEAHINEWFDVIAVRAEELQKGSYEDAKGELVEIAAFLGVQIERHMRGVWERYINEENDYESCSVKIPCCGLGENVLKLLMGGYAGNGIYWTKDCYIRTWIDWRNSPNVRECKIREISATTKEMHRELYDHHAELAERFQRRTGLEIECMDKEHINRWFDVIAARAEELQKGSYEEAKRELMEMAAFLGVQVERHMGRVWKLALDKKDGYKNCYVMEIRSGVRTNVLDELVGGYLYNDIEWTKDRYIVLWRICMDMQEMD